MRPSHITLLAILASFPAYGQAESFLRDPSVVYRLDANAAVLIDSTRKIRFTDILTPEFQRRFRPSEGNLTFGYLKSPVWLKLRLRNVSDARRWLLEIPAPFLEYVDFYQRDAFGNWRHAQSGYFRKYSERNFSHTGHVLPLVFDADSSSVVYVRIGGQSPKTFPLYATEEEVFREKTRLEDLGYGIFFGVLFVMFLYNLGIYIILRQRIYVYYFVTIVFTFLLFGAISGYGAKFVWPEVPVLNYVTGKLLIEPLLISLAVLTIRFLDIQKYSRVMYRLMQLLIALSVLALVLVVTEIFAFAGNTLVSFATVLFIATGIVVRIKGNPSASYFIAAWTVYFAGGLLIALRNTGLLNYNFWTTHCVEIGAVLETAIIGFALGEQYRRYKKEKEEAQRLAVKVQEDAMAWLDRKVQERTEEVSKAHDELQRTLEKNREQTQLIEAKNAELDSFFHSVSHDLKGPISSILGLTMLAKLDVTDPRALDFFDRQQVQLERLRNIVNGLVRLARLSNGGLLNERIDFDELIDACITSFQWVPNFSKIAFRKSVEPGLEFYSDWTLLNGIVQNLIENSVKYASAENPYVDISVRSMDTGIALQVADNGQGIPEEHQAHIFDRHYRATERQGGSGLGLYILKRSVDRLNGTIETKSTVGVGTTFTVLLPHTGRPQAEGM